MRGRGCTADRLRSSSRYGRALLLLGCSSLNVGAAARLTSRTDTFPDNLGHETQTQGQEFQPGEPGRLTAAGRVLLACLCPIASLVEGRLPEPPLRCATPVSAVR
jgi:hypothetical protein